MNPGTQTANQQTILRRINAQLDREIEKGLAETERLLRELLVVCLDKTHRRLIRGQIGLSQYYKNTQMLVCCAQRLNGEDE